MPGRTGGHRHNNGEGGTPEPYGWSGRIITAFPARARTMGGARPGASPALLCSRITRRTRQKQPNLSQSVHQEGENAFQGRSGPVSLPRVDLVSLGAPGRSPRASSRRAQLNVQTSEPPLSSFRVPGERTRGELVPLQLPRPRGGRLV